MRGAQERALLVPDDNIVIYSSCTIFKMKTTVVGVQQHFSLNSTWYVVYKSTVLNKYRLLYTQLESNSVLVADGNATSAVSSTRREELDQNTYGLRNR